MKAYYLISRISDQHKQKVLRFACSNVSAVVVSEYLTAFLDAFDVGLAWISMFRVVFQTLNETFNRLVLVTDVVDGDE